MTITNFMDNIPQNPENASGDLPDVSDKSDVSDELRFSLADYDEQTQDAEADAICNAGRYQRSPGRLDTRAGSYKRKFLTSTGEVELTVPRLRSLPFETQIIKRYQTKQSSVEEALIEMYLAGVSVRRVEDAQ